jgi:hypothetical protein
MSLTASTTPPPMPAEAEAFLEARINNDMWPLARLLAEAQAKLALLIPYRQARDRFDEVCDIYGHISVSPMQ